MRNIYKYTFQTWLKISRRYSLRQYISKFWVLSNNLLAINMFPFNHSSCKPTWNSSFLTMEAEVYYRSKPQNLYIFHTVAIHLNSIWEAQIHENEFHRFYWEKIFFGRSLIYVVSIPIEGIWEQCETCHMLAFRCNFTYHSIHLCKWEKKIQNQKKLLYAPCSFIALIM